MDQQHLECALVRGGTSKGVLVQRDCLPQERQDEVLLSMFGSYEKRQVDGLGGATSTTSKLMIVGASDREGIDVDYTFGQVGVKEPVIDYGGNCGNMTTAIGPFAFDEDIVDATPDDNGRISVRLYNTNTDTVIDQSFAHAEDRAATRGEFKIHGVPGTGARVDTTFHNPAGTTTGELFPLGKPTVTLDTGTETVEVTVLDVTTPVVFVRATDLGATGIEQPSEIDADTAFLERIERIRATACEELGIIDDAADATSESPGFPKIAFVSEPQSYPTGDEEVDATTINITSRIMSMQYLHPIYAVTGASCTAAATLLPGTIPNQVADVPDNKAVTLGHPKGIMSVEAEVENDKVDSVTVSRTQRRLMEGTAFYNLREQ